MTIGSPANELPNSGLSGLMSAVGIVIANKRNAQLTHFKILNIKRDEPIQRLTSIRAGNHQSRQPTAKFRKPIVE
jgi:hypothetical protein